jgi:DNA-binding NarL/FixJ family response regulator
VQVLRQVAGGSTNKEIASELGVAVSTVERHLVNLYTKIGARGRADAIAYALRHRLGTALD